MTKVIPMESVSRPPMAGTEGPRTDVLARLWDGAEKENTARQARAAAQEKARAVSEPQRVRYAAD